MRTSCLTGVQSSKGKTRSAPGIADPRRSDQQDIVVGSAGETGGRQDPVVLLLAIRASRPHDDLTMFAGVDSRAAGRVGSSVSAQKTFDLDAATIIDLNAAFNGHVDR
jgi:hypothetical protein